ncbi:NAD(P)H-dependent glycerol-3-phosphate dehydrogenase [Desulfothermus okinawensis JCM 13304]
MRIGVLGAGSWGTTLANLLASKGHNTTLWVREIELLEEIRKKRINTWFLPDIKLNSGLKFTNSLKDAVVNMDFILIVVPAQFIRGVVTEIRPYLEKNKIVVSASKGIEVGTLKTISEVIMEELLGLDPVYAVLSGPSFAKEVSLGYPTAVSLGCSQSQIGEKLQKVFSTKRFRVYLNEDYRGVELGGAIKNVIAIGAGICDGLGFGYDPRAALITRGLAEMSRLGVAMGAKKETFMGLSGLGDLVLTCTGDLSRNRQVGLRIGRGERLEDILKGMKMVAEGVKTCEALYLLGTKKDVEMPITEQVYRILYEEKDPKRAVEELMLRDLKSEHY